MTADKSITLASRLRFPEFRDSAEWHKVSLSRLLKFQNGYPFASSDFGEERQGLRLIRNRDLRSEDRVVYYDGHPLPEFIVNDGDLLVGMDGDFTPCVWHKGTGLLNQRVGRILPRGKHVLPFLGYLLETHLKVVQEDTARTTVKHLSSRTVEGMVVHVPNPDEQQRIADCLGSLDDLLAAEGHKLEALRQHKQGLMQQLLPQPGQTVPRLRFPEFRNAGEWQQKRLADLGSLISGLTYSPKDVRDNGLLVLRSSNIQNGEIALDDCVYVRHDINGANFTQPDDILICVRNGSRSLIGKNAIVSKGMPACTHGAFMTIFRATYPHFARVLLQSTAFHKQVAADLGATINSINKSQLLKYRFTVPKPAEQQKIADCLGSLDDLIAAEGRMLDALRHHKQGLMQQLFPSQKDH